MPLYKVEILDMLHCLSSSEVQRLVNRHYVTQPPRVIHAHDFHKLANMLRSIWEAWIQTNTKWWWLLYCKVPAERCGRDRMQWNKYRFLKSKNKLKLVFVYSFSINFIDILLEIQIFRQCLCFCYQFRYSFKLGYWTTTLVNTTVSGIFWKSARTLKLDVVSLPFLF